MKKGLDYIIDLLSITKESKQYLLVSSVFIISILNGTLEYFIFSNVSDSITQVLDPTNNFSKITFFLIPIFLIIRALASLLIYKLSFLLARKLATKLYMSLIFLRGSNFIQSLSKNNRDDTSVINIGIRSFIESLVALSNLVSLTGLLLLIFFRFFKYLNSSLIIFLLLITIVLILLNFFIIRTQSKLQKQIKSATDTIFSFCANIPNIATYSSTSQIFRNSIRNFFSLAQIKLRNKQTANSSLVFLPSAVFDFIFYLLLVLASYFSYSISILSQEKGIPGFIGNDSAFLIVFFTRLSSFQTRLSNNITALSKSFSYSKSISRNLKKRNYPFKKDFSIENENKAKIKRNLIFRFHDEKITFDAFEGQHIFLTGASGSGKSTIVKNIISGNCISYKSKFFYNLANTSSLFTYIDDKFYLIEGSVLDNILLGTNLNNHDQFKIDIAFQYSEIHKIFKEKSSKNNLIEKLSNRSSSGLSSGEKQRINIARNILLGGPFFLFDEGSSNLPLRDHIYLIDYITKSSYFKSSIFVSHHKYIPNLDESLKYREIKI